MLRDQMLARTSRFPASYNEADMRAIVSSLLSSFLSNKWAFPSLVSEESKEKASHYCEWVHHDLLYDGRARRNSRLDHNGVAERP